MITLKKIARTIRAFIQKVNQAKYQEATGPQISKCTKSNGYVVMKLVLDKIDLLIFPKATRTT